ncbi:TIGR02391 family protein [Nocardia alba]|nr:TIGR02391 family protein [Nocardia alba]
MEVAGAILDRLYPDWAQQNIPELGADEPEQEVRDAVRRLIVRLDYQNELIERLGGTDTEPQISARSLHPLVWKAATAQWSTGHRHEAVLAAAKAVNSLLQKKTRRRDCSEGELIKQAFSHNPPEQGKPRLRYDRISNEQTAKSMRIGVMDFGAGCFGAIRNPIGHLPNDEVELDEQSALERLCALSLLARWIEEADLLTA